MASGTRLAGSSPCDGEGPYRPKRGETRDVTVELTDQFGTLRERTSKPQLLCTPVVKTPL